MAKIIPKEENALAQEDELIAIGSILENDLKVHAKAAWNAWKPLDVSIRVRSQDNSKVWLVLRVTCSAEYPAKRPEIKIERFVGVPECDLPTLLDDLNELCKEKERNKEVVIADLQIRALEFLYRYPKKGPNDFYEEMLDNKMQKETEEQQQKALKEQQELAEIENEKALQKERLSARKAEKEREHRMRMKSLSSVNDRGESFKVKLLDDSTLEIHKSLTESAPVRRLPHPCVSEWIAFSDDEQTTALVTEWQFEYTLGRTRKGSTGKDLTQFERDLDEFVADILRRLRSLDSPDQSLYSYLFVHLIKRSTSSTNFKCSVLIGQNVDPSHRTLQMDLTEVRTRSKMLLPVFASSAVCALKWLYDQHLYHGSIDKSSIWRSPESTFKISDFYVVPGLLKMAIDFAQITSESRENSPPSPPPETKTSLKSAQQRDMFAVGTMMMDIHGESSSDSLPSLCAQFIDMCQQGVANADQLLDHEYLNRGFFENLHLTKSTISDDPVGSYESQKSSRLMSEWTMRKHLGGGGFGDVILAKNKLDGNDYAIKRIRLNPRSEQLNRKITREAKLFSKLNHPNIVRYYNAWIENVNAEKRKSESSNESFTHRGGPGGDSMIVLEKVQYAENMAKSMELTTEWTPSFKRVEQSHASSESSSEGGLFGYQPRTVFSPQHDISADSDFDILFEHSHADGACDPHSDEISENLDQTDDSLIQPNVMQVLYIQMEFCPKSTLRNHINTGNLFRQPKKVWRIFREILNGLQYIHHQGMVHRDIKPMNILLGVNDEAKIGDFGLATRGDVRKLKKSIECIGSTSIETTRDVGTMFYMAPELDSTGRSGSTGEPRLSAKMDVYSAGIVLFEMFYSPLFGMERVDTLKHLRSALRFPDDFGLELEQEGRGQAKLAEKHIRWMLETNPDNRPTVDQILMSDELPLVELEVTDFQEMYQQVVRNKKANLYKWVMKNLFETPTTSASNYLFDHSICVEMANLKMPSKPKKTAKHVHIEKIEHELSKCFRIHAFEPLTTQSLLPYTRTTSDGDYASSVKALDESGFVFTLPACLRRNFIRYCNHAQISRCKRYTFGKTFHNTDGGLHPNERIECAVDVVGQTSTVELMEAEILSVATALTTQLEALKSFHWVLRVGHTMLIRCAMNHYGLVDEDLQKRVLTVLSESRTLTRMEKHTRLMLMCALKSEQTSSLLDSLERSEKLQNVQASVRSILKNKRSDIREVAKSALAELERVFAIFDVLSAERQSDMGAVVVDPTLCYRPELFSDGFVFQLEITVRKSSGKEIVYPILAGGRYDKTLAVDRYSSEASVASTISAVGFNLHVDALANITASKEKENLAPCTAMVCSSTSALIKERYSIAQQLRTKGVSTDVLSDPVRYVESLEDHCRTNGIAYLLVVLDHCTVLVLTPTESDKGGVKMSFEEAVARVAGPALQDTVVPHAVPTTVPQNPVRQVQVGGATFSNVDVVYAMKLSHNARKKLESQVRATTTDLLAAFSAKRRITICVCELPTDAVRQLAARIDRNFSVTELSSVFNQAGKMKQSGKMKQDIMMIFDELHPIFSNQSRSLEPVILYSIDGFYKVIV